MGDLKVYKGIGQAKYKNHQLNIHKAKSVSVNFLWGICKCNMNGADWDLLNWAENHWSSAK